MAYVLSILNRDLNENGEYDSVNESNDRSFTVAIRNDDITASRTVDYIITGVTESDLGLSSLEGTFNLRRINPGTIRDNDDYLYDTVEFTVSQDTTTEGLERFALSLVDEPDNVVRIDITDTSRGAVGGTIGFTKREVRAEYFDNGTFTIDLTVTGSEYADGDELDFYIDGTAAQYVSPATGSFSISGNSASQVFTKNIPQDSPIGDLYFELKLTNGSTEPIQFPIFRERAPVSYDLVVDNHAPQRSESFVVTLFTTGYDAGDTLPFTVVSGSSQVTQGATGSFTVDANGKATTTFNVSASAVDDIFRLRLDNGQAKIKVIIRNNDEVDLTVPTLNFPNIGTSSNQDQESGFQAIIEELANLRKLATPSAFHAIAFSLDQINNSLTQATTRNTAILQSISDQLTTLREDISDFKDAATSSGIRTIDPYGEIYLAAGFKQLILEGGILRKDDATKDDSNVRELLATLESKPDQELKGESIKYLRSLIAQAKDALGDLE